MAACGVHANANEAAKNHTMLYQLLPDCHHPTSQEANIKDAPQRRSIRTYCSLA